jgi:hypothetical protein
MEMDAKKGSIQQKNRVVHHLNQNNGELKALLMEERSYFAK